MCNKLCILRFDTFYSCQELKERMEKNNFTGRFHPLACDLTDENDILRAFKWIDEHVGGIHFMINNAGIIRISPILGENVSTLKEKWKSYHMNREYA